MTAANVSKTSGTTVQSFAGETITAGQSVYSDPTEAVNKIKLADADVLATASCAGISLNGGASGQPIDFLSGGVINPGATTAAGTVYVVSTTAGGIGTTTDPASGDFVSVIGIGTATNAIKVSINNSGVAVP